MIKYAAAYLGAGVAFAAIDALWLSTMANRLYRPAIGPIMADKPNMVAAVAFYLIYLFGVVFLAIAPALRDGQWTRALIAVDIDYVHLPGRDAREGRARANREGLNQAARLIRLAGWGGLVAVDLVGTALDPNRITAMAKDALMQPESRDAYFRLLADGWTDAVRTLNPRGGVWTYWDYQAGAWQRDHGFRIDHILLTPELADRLESVSVDREHRGREKASDHAPVWARISG